LAFIATASVADGTDHLADLSVVPMSKRISMLRSTL